VPQLRHGLAREERVVKIKLDNLDRDDGSVMITTVDDRPFLLTALLAEGYDVDDSEYVEPARPRSAS
jgi:hypothetical protein